MKKLLLFFSLLLFITASCVNENAETLFADESCYDTLGEISFATDVQPILEKNCTTCHKGPNPPNDVNLTTFLGVQEVALDGRLFNVINHSPGYPKMPRNGGRLEQCTIDTIKKWIDDGALNN